MNKREKVGIIMMLISIVFFGIFIWWGTTSYPADFAVGIIILASGIFLAGILTFMKGSAKEDHLHSHNGVGATNEPLEKLEETSSSRL